MGTVSLRAGLDLHTGRVTELVTDRHASADFIALLGKLDAEYPAQARIRLLLDNHSAPISKETQAYLSLHPQRFEFVFTPQHGSWLKYRGNHVQQNGTNHAAWHPRRQQAGVD